MMRRSRMSSVTRKIKYGKMKVVSVPPPKGYRLMDVQSTRLGAVITFVKPAKGGYHKRRKS